MFSKKSLERFWTSMVWGNTPRINCEFGRPPISFLTLALGFVAGLLLLFFGEIIPKIWAQQFTVSWTLGVTPFMKVWSRWISPVSQAATSLAHVLLLGQARQRGRSPFLHKSEL